MTNSIKLAYHNPTKQIVHIDKASNGINCDCKCIICEEQLEARQGPVRDWHFKHHKNPHCSGGQETALHQLGKQILVANSGKLPIAIPGHGRIEYSNAVAEKELSSTRPDVTAIFGGKEIYFEIAVTHFVEPEKEDFFIREQHTCVEIDLSEISTESYEEIENVVLNHTENKKIIFWEKEIEKESDNSWIDKWVIAAAGFFFIRFLIRSFGGRRR